MIFKNSAEYKAAYRLAVKNCNNIPGLAVLVRSTKNILDFDFYVDLFTGLVKLIWSIALLIIDSQSFAQLY